MPTLLILLSCFSSVCFSTETISEISIGPGQVNGSSPIKQLQNQVGITKIQFGLRKAMKGSDIKFSGMVLGETMRIFSVRSAGNYASNLRNHHELLGAGIGGKIYLNLASLALGVSGGRLSASFDINGTETLKNYEYRNIWADLALTMYRSETASISLNFGTGRFENDSEWTSDHGYEDIRFYHASLLISHNSPW